MKIECNGFYLEIVEKVFNKEGKEMGPIPKDKITLNKIYHLLKEMKSN